MPEPLDLPEPPLSETELEIMRLVATGATNREIAHARHISEATVKKHLTNINLKLGTGNRTEAVRRALEAGLVRVEAPAEPRAARGDGAAADAEVARRLAEELERTRMRTRRFLVLAIGLVLLLSGTLAYVLVDSPDPVVRPTPAPAVAEPLPSGQPFWIPGAPLLGGPRAGLALATVGSTVYAIGGGTDRGVLSDTLRYERGLVNQWRPESAKPTAVRDVAAVVIENRIVIPGGCTADGATSAVEFYDPATRTWSAGAPLPKPVCGYGLAVLQGRIYLFGGRSGDDAAGATDEVWTYRLGDAAWAPVAEVDRMPQPRADMAVAVVDESIHLLGGRDPSGERWPDHWIFRPFAASKWDTSSGLRLPEGRAGHVAAGIVHPGVPRARRWIYVVGGGWDAALQPGALLLDLDAGESWRAFADLGTFTAGQTPQRGASLTMRDSGGQLFLAGGQTAAGRRLDRVHILNLNPTNMPGVGAGE